MNGGPPGGPSPAQGVRQGVGGLLHDVITLAELQAQLFGVDARESAGRIALPVSLLGAAAVLGASSLPLLLIFLAFLLRDYAGFGAAWAVLTAAVVGLVLSGALVFAGYLGLLKAAKPFARSRDELTQNLAWLKEVLKGRHRAETSAVPPAAYRPPSPR